jgi:hypothetical protein
MSGWTPLGDHVIGNGAFKLISHPLARRPRHVIISPPKIPAGSGTAGGIIVDVDDPAVDRTKQLKIFATGYGVAITITVAVM